MSKCPESLFNILLTKRFFSFRWKYALFLALDANFRLKRKSVSSEAVDPSLNRGCAYFVEEGAYKTHLAGYGMQVDEVRASEYVVVAMYLTPPLLERDLR